MKWKIIKPTVEVWLDLLLLNLLKSASDQNSADQQLFCSEQLVEPELGVLVRERLDKVVLDLDYFAYEQRYLAFTLILSELLASQNKRLMVNQHSNLKPLVLDFLQQRESPLYRLLQDIA